MPDEPLTFGEIAVVGGGCYGRFYTEQLESALARGKVAYRRLLVVDRDAGCQVAGLGRNDDRELVPSEWDPFFDAFLERERGPDGPRDLIVPSPLMPHLLYDWIARRARMRWPGRLVEPRPLGFVVGTPFETVAPDGTAYVSFADWLCPTHCIEPATCPVIRAPRTWDMADAIPEVVARAAQHRPIAGPVLFECRHVVQGVGAIPVDQVLLGDRLVDAAGASGDPVDVVVGTISGCHGAVSALHLGPGREPGRGYIS